MAGGSICPEDSAYDYDLCYIYEEIQDDFGNYFDILGVTSKTFRSLDGGETFEELAEMPEERKKAFPHHMTASRVKK